MNPARLTLGSLFDGSGGFPLAALHVGVRPVWAAEVEPFPILVTTTRLPEVTHLGDVSRIDGAAIEPVDIVSFGSPCQDLSVAGRQVGLAGSRSGLFFQAVRIIKEMREATNGTYPRFALWENVPGAFSSNKACDFAAVLTSLIQVANPDAPDVPVPKSRWVDAGCLLADGCSVAWRVLDAQYFGLAQRRRRIYLVADFAGRCAPEILFEPQSLPGHPDSGGTQEQNHAPRAPGRAGDGGQECRTVVTVKDHPCGGPIKVKPDGSVETLTTSAGTTGHGEPIFPAGAGRRAFALNSIHQSRPGGGHYGYEATVSKTLDLKGGEPTCNQGGMVILEPVYAASKADYFTRATKDQAGALLATDYTDPPMVAGHSLRPRRLTPLECARLQGFPDEWCDQLAIENPSDAQLDYWVQVWAEWNRLRGVRPRSRKQVSKWLAAPGGERAEYKLWGNGIALPVAEHVLERLKNVAETTG